MRVAVFGLGYVGSVSRGTFRPDGHEVVGVDVNRDKVAAVNAGRSPIVEPGLDELLASVAAGRLRATGCTQEAMTVATCHWCASEPPAGRTAAST